MTYKLNDKMRNRTTYEVDTNEYRIRLDANESFIDPGKLFGEGNSESGCADTAEPLSG